MKVARENDNIDLSLSIDDEIIIIENKMKSIPEKKQLQRYWAKIKTDKKNLLLVSYFKPLFTMEKNWKHLSYEDLCKRLKKCLNEAPSLDENDAVFISNYVEFLELLNQFQKNVELKPSDKIGSLWEIINDKDIQAKLNEINFEKTFQRVFITKFILKALENFKYSKVLAIDIGCGRDLKVCGDIAIKSEWAFKKEEQKPRDLIFLGIGIWGSDYRYYAGLNKAKCGILDKKDGRIDAKNKQKGYEYLSEKYPWLYNQKDEQKATWGGYSYANEMYLYKKIDISQKTVEEITEKVKTDLAEIYEYFLANQ